MEAHAPYAVFPVFNCGVDWLTCSSNYKGTSNPLEEFGYSVLHKKFAGEGQLSPAKHLGYEGHQAEGIFCGRGAQGVLLQLSGPSCTPLTAEAITRSTGVSRIDLQVTVWTEGEAPRLAEWTYNLMVRDRGHGVGRGTLRLTKGYPHGETLNVGARSSEAFGRLYDKSAEAKLGAPRLLWRYEVEWKGRRARWLATEFERLGLHPTDVSSLVHDFYTKRGVRPAFDQVTHENAFHPFIACPTRSVLDWMRQSLSVTIAKAINQHGRQAVMEALGLSETL